MTYQTATVYWLALLRRATPAARREAIRLLHCSAAKPRPVLAMELRIEGLTLRAIGDRLGIGPNSARMLILKAQRPVLDVLCGYSKLWTVPAAVRATASAWVDDNAWIPVALDRWEEAGGDVPWSRRFR